MEESNYASRWGGTVPEVPYSVTWKISRFPL